MILLLLSCLLCSVVRETQWSADAISKFGSQHCVERDVIGPTLAVIIYVGYA